jgi:hypothetical protein
MCSRALPILQQQYHIRDLSLKGRDLRLEFSVVLQSLAELFLLVTKLSYLSFEGFDVLSRALSDNPLRFSVVCTLPLKLSFGEGIDTSHPNPWIRWSLRCRQAACRLLLGLAPGTLSCRGFAFRVCGALHHA